MDAEHKNVYIFYVYRGEVKVIVDPEQHKTQYPKYYNYRFDPLSAKSGEDFESMKQERFEHIKLDFLPI